MTNKLALIVGLILVAVFVFDYVQYDLASTIFISRKLAALIEWMAFWR